MSDLQDRVAALYREPPERFVAARDALVKELRAGGATEEASDVKRRKRPSVAAWALDQLAARDLEGVDELLAAGSALRGAQQRTLSGRGGDAMRDATAARRAAVSRLMRVATEVLRETGRSPDAVEDELTSTLEAASADEAVGEQLRAGTLERTVSGAIGFGDVLGLQALEGGGDVTTTEDDAATAGDRDARIERLEAEREAADAVAAEAADAVETARTRVGEAEASLASARAALREAETRARGASMNARRAAKELDRAASRSARRR